MPEVNAAAKTLELFAEPRPTLDEAWAIIGTIPLRARFRLRPIRRCSRSCCRAPGARGHGPYWEARWTSDDGREQFAHVGSNGNKLRLELARDVLAEEHERLRAAARAVETLEAKRLRAFEARAGVSRDREDAITREVPILATRVK